jgi:hypothetical protein
LFYPLSQPRMAPSGVCIKVFSLKSSVYAI